MKISTLQHRKLLNAARITILIQSIVNGKKISKEIGKPHTEDAKNAKDLVWHNIKTNRETIKLLSNDQKAVKFRISHNLT